MLSAHTTYKKAIGGQARHQNTNHPFLIKTAFLGSCCFAMIIPYSILSFFFKLQEEHNNCMLSGESDAPPLENGIIWS